MTDGKKTDDKGFSTYDAGSDYLKCLDLLIDGQFKKFNLTIKEFFPAGSLKAADKKVIDKPVISFVGTEKRMILGATSQSILHLLTGTKDGQKTIGTKVTVEARVIMAFGDKGYGLRLMPHTGMMVPRGVKQRLGDPAIWHGPETAMKEEPQ